MLPVQLVAAARAVSHFHCSLLITVAASRLSLLQAVAAGPYWSPLIAAGSGYSISTCHALTVAGHCRQPLLQVAVIYTNDH